MNEKSMRRKSAREVLEAATATHATVVESLKQQRDTYQARLAERTEEVERLNAEANTLYTRLAEAERHREVLAEALREMAGGGCNALAARAALRKCGLLRPQDDPAMIPDAWLPGAEEEEG